MRTRYEQAPRRYRPEPKLQMTKKRSDPLAKFIAVMLLVVLCFVAALFFMGRAELHSGGEEAYRMICAEYEKLAAFNPMGQTGERAEKHEDASGSDAVRYISESDIISSIELTFGQELKMDLTAGANRLWALMTKNKPYVFAEAGADISAYEFTEKEDARVWFIDEPDVSAGCHTVSIGGEKPFTSMLIVTDTVAPVLTVTDGDLWCGDEPTLDTFVVSLSDVSPVYVYCEGGLPDTYNAGERLLYLKAKDICGNESEVMTALLTVKADTEPPVIAGVKNRTFTVGETVAYKQGITVSDNRDSEGDIKLSVDSSKVDTKKAGTYTVTFTAVDRAGNASEKTAKFTFKSTAAKKDDDKLDTYVQKVAKSIFTDGMSKAKQARAIYDWVRDNIYYAGHYSGRSWQKEAIAGFSNKRGDCYTHFACAKALLEYCGIDNIDVEKTRVSSSEARHFWSLVNVGTGYYHFDTTPRTASTKFKGFMRTDEQLLTYSKNNKNSHRFDASKYPATPKEEYAG